MIITLIFVAIVVIGIVRCIAGNNSHSYNDLDGTGAAITCVGCFCVFFCVLIILIEHVGVQTRIAENNITYNALCERQELISSQYEDVSRSDIIKDVADWNVKVQHYQYWAYNPWTCWFYSKKVADNMKPIRSAQ